ncbi:tail fiber protein [Hymenobacter sp. M29]|uniref:Tail fiber protein n=1 Tax=Hymenobacter mellowenesis TaxID=3063995 RepID=A0ABT9AIA1_9BACT|nr:tail fiber protein [Hymenobacter sp. M29]MDO7849600.1 tail fiber protein [Hymenobacter sp. M29]
MEILPTLSSSPSSGDARPASRRAWLKGMGALLGTGLLAAPATVLAAPAPAPDAAALAEGDEHIGVVKVLAGTTLPIGWTLCDGRMLLVAEHPALFAVLGATYGGDGHHTFALPYLGEPTPGGTAATQLAIKTANGPATTTALAELRMRHQRRSRPAVA